MLKELLKNKEFLKIIRKFLRKIEIIDIILFGSAIKGKEKPQDIDFLIIYAQQTKNILEINYEFKKNIEKIFKNVEIIGKKYAEVFNPEFLAREDILSAGFSMKQKKFISEAFGYKGFILFKYSLGKMNKSKRMQFYYSLYGRRKEKGILEKYGCYKFSDSVILAIIDNSELIKNFFNEWKIEYIEFPLLIPERVARENIFRGLK